MTEASRALRKACGALLERGSIALVKGAPVEEGGWGSERRRGGGICHRIVVLAFECSESFP